MRVFFLDRYVEGGWSEAWPGAQRRRGLSEHYRGARCAIWVSAHSGGAGGSRDNAAPCQPKLYRPTRTFSLIGGYAASFYCPTFALNTLPIAVVYATWSGLGIFLINFFGYVLLHQSLDWRAIAGLSMIVAGVVLVNTFAPHK